MNLFRTGFYITYEFKMFIDNTCISIFAGITCICWCLDDWDVAYGVLLVIWCATLRRLGWWDGFVRANIGTWGGDYFDRWQWLGVRGLCCKQCSQCFPLCCQWNERSCYLLYFSPLEFCLVVFIFAYCLACYHVYKSWFSLRCYCYIIFPNDCVFS